jgi:hypothetical protein
VEESHFGNGAVSENQARFWCSSRRLIGHRVVSSKCLNHNVGVCPRISRQFALYMGQGDSFDQRGQQLGKV